MATAFGCAHAQSIQTLDPVVVSASRAEQPLSEVLVSTTVITREEINRSQAPTLIELLEGDTGIEIGRNGGVGTVSSFFLRGQNSTNTAVFIDGVRLVTDQIAAIRLTAIPTQRIERIEVLRGNVSALYGESATGGVVHIYTRQPSAERAASAAVAFGPRGSRQTHVNLGGSADDLTFSLGIDSLDTEGFSAINTSQKTSNPDKDGFSRKAASLSAEKRVSPGFSIGLNLNQQVTEVEFDSEFNNDRSTEELLGETRESDATLLVKGRLQENLRTQVAVSLQEEDYREFSNAVQLSTSSGGHIAGRQRSLRLDNTLAGERGSVVFGLDARSSDFSSYGTRHDRVSQGIYGGIHNASGKFDYQFNLRYDRIEGSSPTASQDFKKVSGLAGLGYTIMDQVRITLTGSTGFRAPATGELYGFGGTTSLQPEAHRSLEMGVNIKSHDSLSRLAVFKTQTTNAIVYNSACASPYTNCYQNVAEVQNRGLELSYQRALGRLKLKGSYTLQEPRNRSAVAFSGQRADRLARRADHFGSISMTSTFDQTDLGVHLRHSGNRIDGAQTLGSYTVVNFTLSQSVKRGLTVRFKLENAFDEKYQLAYGFNTPRRGAYMALEYRE